jgi:hypothetical protein
MSTQSKCGGKQWQTTPKNLDRMQRTRYHTGRLTGLWFLPRLAQRPNTTTTTNNNNNNNVNPKLPQPISQNIIKTK